MDVENFIVFYEYCIKQVHMYCCVYKVNDKKTVIIVRQCLYTNYDIIHAHFQFVTVYVITYIKYLLECIHF